MDVSGLNNNLVQYYNSMTKNTEKTNEFQKLLDDIVREKDDQELKKACEEFESYYLQELYGEMRKTIPENTLLDKSEGRDIYEDMLYEEYAKLSSKGSGAGLAQMLYKQLSKDTQNS